MTRCVVAGIDGSAASLAAARWAADEAAARGAVLRLVHAEPLQPQMLPTVPGAGAAARLWETGTDRMLRRAVADLAASHPDLEVEGVRVTDTAAAALTAQGASAELAVVASRGLGGFSGLLVGAVALQVAGQMPCPVAVLPAATDLPGGGEVVLALDARDPADEVIDFAFDTAARRGVPLRAVHAWNLPQTLTSAWLPFAVPEKDRAEWEDQEVQLLSDALAGWREKYPSVWTIPDVVLFSPARAVVNASLHAGLLVLGRHSPGGTLSPTTHAALHHARCPVVVVPHA